MALLASGQLQRAGREIGRRQGECFVRDRFAFQARTPLGDQPAHLLLRAGEPRAHEGIEDTYAGSGLSGRDLQRR